ncbi:MAG: UDP-N-acetylmuramoyl-L-alanyl-D-glutamate--2,6-diaminopimelate ligase [Bacilli bacterium]|nr:UDP-N-acetylmuramoyl-L-alanyl-D-glutamate--2,6-diaminopimelate ligase [Bacilli bacterium]
MKKLKELIKTDYDVNVFGIKINSKEVEKGDMFVCIKGVKTDRHDFIEEAIKNGASCIIGEKDIECSIPYVKVKNTNYILPELCRKFYDFDRLNLKIIGVTGTDGKTTTTTSIQYLIGKDKCGYIGTNGVSCAKFTKDSPNSTPDPTLLYKYFKEFYDAGCEYVVMEASSEGFLRGRLDDLYFTAGGYTNISWEHVNVHGSFDNYVKCKLKCASQTNGKFIINNDDEYHDRFKEKALNTLSYGESKNSDLYIKDYTVTSRYTNVTFVYLGSEYSFTSPLLGKFNVYNLACAMLICLSLGFDMESLIENTMNIDVSGRVEMINLGQNFQVMVDYAHTPNGIKSILDFVRILEVNRAIVVIGSAGERDYKKRPIMGRTVIDNADYAIFTYEDPRSEDPLDIINQMTSEIDDKSKYEIVVDRSLAIKKAIDIARPNDIVLVLGKGSETYEKLKNETIYFNDMEESRKWIKERLEREKISIAN